MPGMLVEGATGTLGWDEHSVTEGVDTALSRMRNNFLERGTGPLERENNHQSANKKRITELLYVCCL